LGKAYTYLRHVELSGAIGGVEAAKAIVAETNGPRVLARVTARNPTNQAFQWENA